MDKSKICDVCKKEEMIGIFSSRIAPVSLGYCKSCLDNYAEPYYVLVLKLHNSKNFYERRGEDIFESDKYKQFIEGTLKNSEKSLKQLKHDVETNARPNFEQR